MKQVQKISLALALAGGLWMVAATGCCTDQKCTRNQLGVSLKGFDSTDIDTILVRRYSTDLATGTPVDTIQMSSVNARGDTASLGVLSFSDGFKSYVLDFPALQRTVRIEQAVFSQETVRYCVGSLQPPYCYNRVVSCRIDGQINSTDVAWIVK